PAEAAPPPGSGPERLPGPAAPGRGAASGTLPWPDGPAGRPGWCPSPRRAGRSHGLRPLARGRRIAPCQYRIPGPLRLGTEPRIRYPLSQTRRPRGDRHALPLPRYGPVSGEEPDLPRTAHANAGRGAGPAAP